MVIAVNCRRGDLFAGVVARDYIGRFWTRRDLCGDRPVVAPSACAAVTIRIVDVTIGRCILDRVLFATVRVALCSGWTVCGQFGTCADGSLPYRMEEKRAGRRIII